MEWVVMDDALWALEVSPGSMRDWMDAKEILERGGFTDDQLREIYLRLLNLGRIPDGFCGPIRREMAAAIQSQLRERLPPMPEPRTPPKPRGRLYARVETAEPPVRQTPPAPSVASPSHGPLQARLTPHKGTGTDASAATTPVYHVTHVDNLPGILAEGGLLSHAALRKKGTDYVDISDGHIQAKRARKIILCWEPCPTVDQFVPFAFRPCPLMLRQVAYGFDVDYAGGLEPLVHFVVSAEDVHRAGIDYAISSTHPLNAQAQWGYTLAALHNLVAWELIHGPMLDKSDERHTYQLAEFLVRDQLPWSLIGEIAVMTKGMQARVAKELAGAAHRPTIAVRPEWYRFDHAG